MPKPILILEEHTEDEMAVYIRAGDRNRYGEISRIVDFSPRDGSWMTATEQRDEILKAVDAVWNAMYYHDTGERIPPVEFRDPEPTFLGERESAFNRKPH